MPCAHWGFTATEQYKGDFNVKTDNPILFMSSIYDPVTPMGSAYNASAVFEGNVVVGRGDMV
jgi:hypothetical protein